VRRGGGSGVGGRRLLGSKLSPKSVGGGALRLCAAYDAWLPATQLPPPLPPPAAAAAAARFAAAPGAGFFLDTPSLSGAYLSHAALPVHLRHAERLGLRQPGERWGPAAAELRAGVAPRATRLSRALLLQGCVAAYASLDPSNAWKCFMAQYSAWYIRSQLFVSNALYDSWQADNIMGLGCDPGTPGSCSAAQMAYLQARRSMMGGRGGGSRS